MSKRRSLIYAAYKNGNIIKQGTADELADYFKVTRSVIGNFERTGRKIKKEYLIERMGWEDEV